MPDEFDSLFVKRTGVGMEIHSPSKNLMCSGCGKKFTKDSDLLRHWRVPIPCQMPNCPRTFRDDKLKAYLNHHASEHHNDEQNELNEAHLKSYFRDMGKQLRREIVPSLCVNRPGSSPKSNVTYSRNMSSLATISSTEPWNNFSSYDTGHADVNTSLPSLSAPGTNIGSSPLAPLAPIMNGLLQPPDFPSNSELTPLGTGFDYGRGRVQPLRPDGHGMYLKEQISTWKKALSTKRHETAYFQRLLASNLTDEQSLEDKIRGAEEELDKILHAKEPDLQAPSDHQLWDTYLVDPALDDQNEV